MGKTRETVTEEEFNAPFPVRLRKLLSVKGETQDKLAHAIGVNRQSIAQWKDALTVPDINSLGKMTDYYNVSADYLLGRTNVKTPEIDIRAICEKTRLTEKALENILDLYDSPHTYGEAFYGRQQKTLDDEGFLGTDYIGTLNKIVEDETFYRLIAGVAEFIGVAKKYKAYHDMIEANTPPPVLNEDAWPSYEEDAPPSSNKVLIQEIGNGGVKDFQIKLFTSLTPVDMTLATLQDHFTSMMKTLAGCPKE